jgi:hypothetical protein
MSALFTKRLTIAPGDQLMRYQQKDTILTFQEK